MKIIHKILAAGLFAGLAMVPGCLPDEQFDIANGGFLAANLYPTPVVSYLRGETTQVDIAYTLHENPGIGIGSVEAVAVLNSKLGDSDPVSFTAVNNQISIPASELFTKFPVGGQVLTEDDLAPGDKWVVSYVLNMASGKRLTIGSRTNINFTCPSNLQGEYDVLSVGNDYYGNPFTYNFTTELTTTSIAGRYVLPDLSGNMEPDIWGNPPVEAIIEEICGKITLVSAPYIYAYFIDEGSVDADGVISITWRNVYGENGVQTLTPIE
jgi:hypothetical protein